MPVCNGPGAFVKEVSATSCGECGRLPPPELGCLERRSDDGWSKEMCPEGMIRHPRNDKQCIKPRCTGEHEFLPPVTWETCGKCYKCNWPDERVHKDGDRCEEKPGFLVADCMSRESADGWTSLPCPKGQITDDNDIKRCVTPPRCTGKYDIQLPVDFENCGACQPCNYPHELPSADKRRCIQRQRPTCSCLQKYSADGYSCETCPPGYVSDADRYACYPKPTCDGPGQILGNMRNCYRCGQCPNNLVPTADRTKCEAVCACNQRQSADG